MIAQDNPENKQIVKMWSPQADILEVKITVIGGRLVNQEILIVITNT